MINPVGPSGPQWVDFFWKNMEGLFRSSGPQGLRTGGLHGALIDAMGLRVRGSFPAPPPAPRAGPLAGWARAAPLWWLRPLLLSWPATGR